MNYTKDEIMSDMNGWCSDRYGCCYVVAWMPLPEPYRVDEE